jgi:hypothetical protein
MTAADQIIPGDQRVALDTAARHALRAPSALNTVADGAINAADAPVAVVKEVRR